MNMKYKTMNWKTTIGKYFYDFLPTFKWEEKTRGNNIRRIQANFRISNPKSRKHGWAWVKIKVDKKLIEYIWEAAEKFGVFVELQVCTRGVNALQFSMEGCVLKQQGNKGEHILNWGKNISFLKHIAKKYEMVAFIDGTYTLNDKEPGFILDENLKIKEVHEWGEGG